MKAGGVVKMGLTGFPPTTFQALGAVQAVAPKVIAGGISGVVWRDFSPNNPTDTTSVLSGEDGYPQLHLSLVNSSGSTVGQHDHQPGRVVQLLAAWVPAPSTSASSVVQFHARFRRRRCRDFLVGRPIADAYR